MTFYLTCSQGQQRSAVIKDVTVVKVMSLATMRTVAYPTARFSLSVAAGTVKCMF